MHAVLIGDRHEIDTEPTAANIQAAQHLQILAFMAQHAQPFSKANPKACAHMSTEEQCTWEEGLKRRNWPDGS